METYKSTKEVGRTGSNNALVALLDTDDAEVEKYPELPRARQSSKLADSATPAKDRMAYCIFASMLACGTLYLNITSFFPLFV